ncbi:MAG TPA: DUF503 domain-containing protein [Candidatus Acidoferrales bacterium]|jgi:uncharacterized protein YlxP (DUF503 family)
MPIGLLTLEIHIPDARSLKDKRQVLRSLKDRLRRHFNVAVAELDHQDTWQRSLVGVVALSADEKHLEESLQLVFAESERLLGRDLIGHQTEFL